MTSVIFISFGLFLQTFADDKVVFGGEKIQTSCRTIGGPAQGQKCQFPFFFKGILRDGCVTENDPEGKAWCSTRVDDDGNHIGGGQFWAHCSSQCPRARVLDSTVQTPQTSGSSSSSAFTAEPQICITKSGSEGTCRLPASCIGATIQFLEDNECQLTDGTVGTCCVPVPVDNIINIIDAPQQTVAIPNNIDVNQVDDVVPRFGPGPITQSQRNNNNVNNVDS